MSVKAHRDEYKDLSFKEQQQELGKKVRHLRIMMSNHANT